MIALTISPENLDDLFEAAGRRLGEGLHKAWWRKRVPAGSESEVSVKAKIDFIALCFVEDDVVGAVETEAQKLVQDWLKEHRVAIMALPDGPKQEYDEIRRLAADPEEGTVSYPHTVNGTSTGDPWKKHLYVEESGAFHQKFTTWEAKVLAAELDRDDVIGWLRNPDRKPWSLRVSYVLGGEWRPLHPDFLLLRQESGGLVIDLLDPHLLAVEDAPAKAAGLAKYAAKHAAAFGRIELIIIKDDKLKRLDLTDETVRNNVKQVNSHEHLRLLFEQA